MGRCYELDCQKKERCCLSEPTNNLAMGSEGVGPWMAHRVGTLESRNRAYKAVMRTVRTVVRQRERSRSV